MSSPSSLYSKLKILVAKLYKAEKLYCSMKQLPIQDNKFKQTYGSNANKKLSTLVFNPKSNKTFTDLQYNSNFSNDSFSKGDSSLKTNNQNLIEHANDVRSIEWYKVHQNFRIKLNDLLSNGNTNFLNESFNNIWLEFLAEFEIAELDLQECNESAKEALNKEEYSYLFKISSELIKRKARLQALKVIHDELNSLLTSNSNRSNINNYRTDYSSLNEILANSGANTANVIPLRRKAAN